MFLMFFAQNGYHIKNYEFYKYHCHPMTISIDLDRTEILELGRKGPYYRFVNYPVEINEKYP